jgi:hypothetical protein
MTRRRCLFPPVLAVLLATCSGAEPAGPGWLDVRLVSPTTDDGGVMFVVRGGPIDSVRSSLPDLYTHQVSASQWAVIVIGNVSSTVVARLWVPDLDAAPDYLATVEQVASGVTFEQRASGQYSLVVE